MKYFINDWIVFSWVPEGPLVALLDGFARVLSAKGYAGSTIYRKVLRAACFSRWLEQREIGLSDLTTEHPLRYLRDQAHAKCGDIAPRVRPPDGDAATLRDLMGYVRLEGVITAENTLVRPGNGVEQCVQAYSQYLRDMRGLVTATVDNYTPFVLRFLRHCFRDGDVVPSRLSAADVVGFVQQQAR